MSQSPPPTHVACSVGIELTSLIEPGVPMNNLLSLHAVTLCQVYTTLCFGAWIQDQSVGLGGCPFKCEGIVLSQTVSFFAAHIAVPDLQGGCFTTTHV